MDPYRGCGGGPPAAGGLWGSGPNRPAAEIFGFYEPKLRFFIIFAKIRSKTSLSTQLK